MRLSIAHLLSLSAVAVRSFAAGTLLEASDVLRRGIDSVESQLEKRVEAGINFVAHELLPRVPPTSPSTPAPSATKASNQASSSSPSPSASGQGTAAAAAPIPTASLPSLNDTKAACITALTALNGKPASQTGMSSCFNIGFLDRDTGEFEGELLLFQVAPATGNWTSVDPKSLQLGLNYPGATVAMGDMAQNKQTASGGSGGKKDGKQRRRRSQEIPDQDLTERWVSTAGASGTLVRRASTPLLVANMSLVGDISEALMPKIKDDAAMMVALAPNVTITATSTSGSMSGAMLNDSLSTKEAAFVNGLFADKASSARQAAISAAANPPFVLPGTSFGIFPIGFIITGAWTVLFFLAVGLGTIGRFMCRTGNFSVPSMPSLNMSSVNVPSLKSLRKH